MLPQAGNAAAPDVPALPSSVTSHWIRQELRKAADEAERLRGEVADQEGLFLQISEAKQEADELRDRLAAATQVRPKRAVKATGTVTFRAVPHQVDTVIHVLCICAAYGMVCNSTRAGAALSLDHSSL